MIIQTGMQFYLALKLVLWREKHTLSLRTYPKKKSSNTVHSYPNPSTAYLMSQVHNNPRVDIVLLKKAPKDII